MTATWALIAGGRGGEKSRVAARVVDALRAGGLAVGGVLQDAVVEDGERVGYRARRVGHPDVSVSLARRGGAPDGARPEARREFCSLIFDDDAFAVAGAWVRESARRDDVVVVDEVSKLEAARGGHHDAIRDALAGRALVVLVVREDQLFDVVERLSLDDAVATLGAGDDGALPAFVAAVARAARAGRRG